VQHLKYVCCYPHDMHLRVCHRRRSQGGLSRPRNQLRHFDICDSASAPEPHASMTYRVLLGRRNTLTHDSSSLYQSASALRIGISAGASTSVSAPQAAVYLSASSNDHLHSVCRRLLHRTAELRVASEDAPFPFGCSPQAALIVRFSERTVSAGGLSAPASFRRSPRTFCSHCY
jgi:hypothetical protein